MTLFYFRKPDLRKPDLRKPDLRKACRKDLRRATVVLAAIAVMSFAWADTTNAQGPETLGSQFQVNEVTTNSQGNPVVASREDGAFIIVWESDVVDEGDLFHRIYDSLGTPRTGEIQVNDQTLAEQSGREHSVSIFPDRSFVIAWDNIDPNNSLINRISARLFHSDGQPNGSQFQVNTLTSGYKNYPSVAAAPDGSFAVVWTSDFSSGTDSFSSSIQMRLSDSDGAPLSSEFQVNTYTTGDQYSPNITYSDDAGFVVAWTSGGSPGDDASGTSVQARRFQSDGTAIGDQFQVNDFTPDEADTVRVEARPDGELVVTWRSYESPGDDMSESSTQARRFASDGSPIGDQFQVNDFTPGNNDDADPAFDRIGGFLVAWESEPDETTGVTPDGSGNAVRLRRFLLDGTPVGDELTVNDFTMDKQDDPVVAVVGLERAVVVFESQGSPGNDASGDSVQVRLIDLCSGPNDGIDADFDQIPDDCDDCQGDNGTGDSDADGVCNDLDACLGDDATGDGDSDGLCADRDCDDGDPFNACAIFADDFETGDTSGWAGKVLERRISSPEPPKTSS